MRTSGLGLSALLIAVGAILAWAVTAQAEGIDLNQVGIILFIVGLGLGLLTLAMSAFGRRTVVQTDRESIVNGRPVVEREREIITDQQVPERS